PLSKNHETTTSTNDENSNYENCELWWNKLANLTESNYVQAYTPNWNRSCIECETKHLPSEQKNFCCNAILKYFIPLLRPLLPILQNIYKSNLTNNFSYVSRQYNSLFSFTTIGYTGGVVNLTYPHAFIVNGHAYHQIHSANMEDYPVNWFVYDANARNTIANRYKLNQNIIDLIEQELARINPFVQGLYQLRNITYPKARLIIHQPTANDEIAAYTIIHSTAITQE
ncbi:18938_t:CDS:1, partial [Dentiscutata erythropus]